MSTDPTDAPTDLERRAATEVVAAGPAVAESPRLRQTPSQTVGPFFGYALPFDGGPHLVPAQHPRAVRLHGVVLDGAGEPVPDALLELWQPAGSGNVVHEPGSRDRGHGVFTGFGRAATAVDGSYEFITLLPGGVPPSTARVATVTVFGRGLLHPRFTRADFVGLDEADPADALLARLPPERRSTLLAREHAAGSFRFDLHLQGQDETVFLDYSEPLTVPPAG